MVGASAGIFDDVKVLAGPGKDPLVEAARDQLYLATMPQRSVRKHLIHRKQTPEFGQDALRAFADLLRVRRIAVMIG